MVTLKLCWSKKSNGCFPVRTSSFWGERDTQDVLSFHAGLTDQRRSPGTRTRHVMRSRSGPSVGDGSIPAHAQSSGAPGSPASMVLRPSGLRGGVAFARQVTATGSAATGRAG